MKHAVGFATILFGLALTVLAQDPESSLPPDCELVALAIPQGTQREIVDGKLRIRFQMLLKDIVLGRVPEGRVLPVLVSAPLPEGWKDAGRAVVEFKGPALLVFLKSEGEGRNAYFVPVGEGIATMDEARIRGFREELAPRVRQAVVDLDSEDFQTREDAEKILHRLGYASEEAVREALKGKPSPEVAMRANRILRGLPRRGAAGARWLIHQPDVNYPNDDVLIWQSASRDRRAFKLSPGTEVDLVEKVDGDRFGSPHIMCKIRTKDGRTGWIPEKWLRYEAGTDEIRPLGPGEKMTREFVERVWMTAVEEWATEFKNAEDKNRVKGFDQYLDTCSKKAGFKDWADFATNASRSLGAEAWVETVQKMSKNMQERMEKIAEEVAKGAAQKAPGAEKKND